VYTGLVVRRHAPSWREKPRRRRRLPATVGAKQSLQSICGRGDRQNEGTEGVTEKGTRLCHCELTEEGDVTDMAFKTDRSARSKKPGNWSAAAMHCSVQVQNYNGFRRSQVIFGLSKCGIPSQRACSAV
jgi:hypothetical protein